MTSRDWSGWELVSPAPGTVVGGVLLKPSSAGIPCVLAWWILRLVDELVESRFFQLCV